MGEERRQRWVEREMDRGMACCCYEIGTYLKLRMTVGWQHCRAMTRTQVPRTHNDAPSNKLPHAQYGWNASLCMCSRTFTINLMHVISRAQSWLYCTCNSVCVQKHACLYTLAQDHSQAFIHCTTHMHNYADTHTHTASEARGHYFWCDVQQLEHAGVLYSSGGTAAGQREDGVLCNLRYVQHNSSE